MEKYQKLMERLEELEQENNGLKSRVKFLESLYKKQEKTLERERVEGKILQTLSLELVNNLRPNELYSIICESLVKDSGWDSACVIKLTGNRATILVSEGVKPAAENHLRDYLSESAAFRKLYQANNAFSTHREKDKDALIFRSLFSCEEAIGLPIMHGDIVYSYLVVCSDKRFSGVDEAANMRYMTNVALHMGSVLRSGASYKALKNQNQKLKQLDDLKDSFISITSHQLRTPLSIVKWILSVLQSEKEVQKSPKIKEFILQAYESNERLIHVVNDLLNVSRIQEGQLPYNLLPIDLGQLVKDTYENSLTICENKQIKIDLEISKELPLLYLDPILFKEAIQNLIYNAVDYNQPNGYIHLKAYQYNDKAYISVANSGMGIAKEDLDHIFEQFYRADEAIKVLPTGSGLGLYLSQAIINEHGGTIICDSHKNKETVFTVIMPIEVNKNDVKDK